MYELRNAVGGSWYMDCPSKVGLIFLGEKDVCAIDGGSDKDAGKKVKKLIDAQGRRLVSIFNTHAHADHIGGNRWLQTQTGCRIFVPAAELPFCRNSLLEPSFLFGGDPPKELRNKFYSAQESEAEPLSEAVLPEGMEIIPLPGHSLGMVGYRSPDDAVYLADCLSSSETLKKYRIPYLYDVGAQLDTLNRVNGLEAKLFVPSHAEACEDIRPLVRENIAVIESIAEDILQICAEPLQTEEILRALFIRYELKSDFGQYSMLISTLRSFLVWLRTNGKAEAAFEDGRLLWSRI